MKGRAWKESNSWLSLWMRHSHTWRRGKLVERSSSLRSMPEVISFYLLTIATILSLNLHFDGGSGEEALP